MLSVDLNCDMGESFGAWSMGNDLALMDLVSSVNIACGFHAGDPSVMRKTVDAAVTKGLAIGAHPGYPDLQGFGRREMALSRREIYDVVVYQVGALMGVANAAGAPLSHVKPHGALYNRASADPEAASAIAEAVRDVNPDLVLVGLSGSVMVERAASVGLKSVSEVFADRTYQDDGRLTPRRIDGALIDDPGAAADQVLHMLLENTVKSVNGRMIAIKPETVCIHGDGHHALNHARAIVKLLKANGIAIKSF